VFDGAWYWIRNQAIGRHSEILVEMIRCDFAEVMAVAKGHTIRYVNSGVCDLMCILGTTGHWLMGVVFGLRNQAHWKTFRERLVE